MTAAVHSINNLPEGLASPFSGYQNGYQTKPEHVSAVCMDRSLSRMSTQSISDCVSEKAGVNSLEELCQNDEHRIGIESLKKVKALGQGAFAEVHLAQITTTVADIQRNSSGGVVAVKKLKNAPENDAIVDFVKEVKILQELRHENIIQFLGLGSSDKSDTDAVWKNMFMVQEYATGGTLQNLLMRQMTNYKKPLYSFQDALHWCQNIADALAFMHSRQPIIIHRDIKCDNILLSAAPDGKGLVAKIGDFGLHARVQPDPDTNALITYALTGKTGAYVYMAPEVLQSKRYNEKVDVFSFGVIMFELFTKSLLSAQYMNTTEWDESEAHASKVAAGYRPPFPAFVPPEVKALITKCWSTTPELRPTMAEVVKALKGLEESGVIDGMTLNGKRAKAKTESRAQTSNKSPVSSETDVAIATASGGCCTVM